MMNCIPGISTKVSTRLASKFSNIKSFLDTLEKIDEDKRISYIQQLKTYDTDKARKISVKVAQNIIDFIGFNKSNNTFTIKQVMNLKIILLITLVQLSNKNKRY